MPPCYSANAQGGGESIRLAKRPVREEERPSASMRNLQGGGEKVPYLNLVGRGKKGPEWVGGGGGEGRGRVPAAISRTFREEEEGP